MKKKIFVFIIIFLLFVGPVILIEAGSKEDIDFDESDDLESTSYADSPCPTFSQNNKRNGRSPYNTSYLDGTEKWRFWTRGFIESSPTIGEDGTVYFGSNDYNVYALYPDGTERWTFKTGGRVQCSPAISADGTIYATSWDYKLYAINPNGTEKWNFTTDDSVGWYGISSSPAIGEDGTIYFGSEDYNFYAINPDGTEKWNFTTGYPIRSSPTITDDGTIYIGSNDRNLYALHPNGTEKWNFTTSASFGRASPAIDDNGHIYILASSDLYALYPNGTKKWEFDTGRSTTVYPYPSYSTPSIGEEGTIYIGSAFDELLAFNPDGTEKWNFTTGSSVTTSPSIGADGTIYIGSRDNYIYAVNPNGTEKWRFETGDDVWSSASIGKDGTLYIGSNDRNMYALTGKHSLTIHEPIGEGTVIVDGLRVVDWPYEGEFIHDVDVDLRAEPDEHWYFDNWTGDETGTDSTIEIKIDEDKNISLIFQENRYDLNVDIEGRGSVEIYPDEYEYDPNSEVDLIADPADGWYFEEWKGCYSGTEEEVTITIDEDKSVIAVFKELYSLELIVKGEGSTNPEEDIHLFEQDEVVTIVTDPTDGWYFEGWKGDYSGTEEEITITIDENKSVTAVFKELYSLEIMIEGDGFTSLTEGTHLYEPGEEVRIESDPAEGWYFEGWKGDLSEAEKNITVILYENKTVTAVFREYYILNLTIEGEGSTNPEEGSYLFEQGEEVTITVYPDEDWHFNKWSGDHTGTEKEITIIMDEDKEISANFEENFISAYWWLIVIIVLIVVNIPVIIVVIKKDLV